MLLLVVALAAAAPDTEQDRVTATEMLAYAEWRKCVLKATHRQARRMSDPAAVADVAIRQCGTRAANYRSAVMALAQLYRLRDADGFARRNVEKAQKALADLAMKELG